MVEVKVNLKETEDAKEFVRLASQSECTIDVSSVGTHYTLDGKSILGVLSLDASKSIVVSINGDELPTAKFLAVIDKFLIRG